MAVGNIENPSSRINITLDLEKEGAGQKYELPMKLLVVGDFSNNLDRSKSPQNRIYITKHNFNQILQNLAPTVSFSVNNKITHKGQFSVNLTIKNLSGFSPDSLLQSIPELKKLIAARNLLKEMSSVLSNNNSMTKSLQKIVSNRNNMVVFNEKLKKLLLHEDVINEDK